MAATPFTPSVNFALAMTGSSVNQALGVGAGNSVLYLYNATTALANVRWGVGAQTAVATDFAVPPGAYFVIAKPSAADNVAAISSGTGNLYLSCGEGE